MTVRRWVLVVAFAAVATWACVLRERSRVFAGKAAFHNFEKAIALSNRDLQTHDPLRAWNTLEDVDRDVVAKFERRSQYEDALARKYRRLAARPWLMATPDPPPPSDW